MKLAVSALVFASVLSADCYGLWKKICPGTSTKVGGQCLSFSEDKASWRDAGSECRRRGGKLASLDNIIAFMDFVNENLGKWRWQNDQYLSHYFPWLSGQPSNHDSEQHCLNFGGMSDGDGYNHFDDGDCKNELKFVCEY